MIRTDGVYADTTSTASPNDETGLIRLAYGGDLIAMGVLVSRYHRAIAWAVTRFKSLSRDHDDLIQDVKINIIRGLPNIKDLEKMCLPGRFESWVFHIARNTSRGALRVKRSTEILLGDIASEDVAAWPHLSEAWKFHPKGTHKSSGPRREDLSGRSFGCMVAERYVGNASKGRAIWECKCTLCGALKNIRATHLKSGDIRTCGAKACAKKYNKDSLGRFTKKTPRV